MARHSLKEWDARDIKENILTVIMYAACDHEKTDDYDDRRNYKKKQRPK